MDTSSEETTRETQPISFWAAEQLRPLLFFTDNWDGYHGLAPNQSAVLSAAYFLTTLAEDIPKLAKPRISATSDGGVLMLWSKKNGKELEIDFGRNQTLEYLFTSPQESIEVEDTITLPNSPKLKKFCGILYDFFIQS